jgi:hypothetical protein
VIIAAIIQRGKEVEESPLLPWHSGRLLDALAFGTSICVLVPNSHTTCRAKCQKQTWHRALNAPFGSIVF